MRASPLGRFAFGEALSDQPDIDNVGVELALNVLPRLRGFDPLPTVQAASTTAMTGQALGGISVRSPTTGLPYTYAGDSTKLYGLSSGAWSNLSQGGGTPYLADKHWSFVQYANTVIASNGEDQGGGSTANDVPQVITLGGSAFADLITTPSSNLDHPRGRLLAIVREFLVMGDVTDGSAVRHRARVQWSGFREPTYMQFNAARQSGLQDLDEVGGAQGGTIKAITSGEVGLVFQEDLTWRMIYVGPSKVFRFDRTKDTIGCIASKSPVRFGDTVYWLSRDGFRSLPVRRGDQTVQIGHEKIDLTVLDELDFGELDAVSGALWQERNCIVWAYPGAGSSGVANKLAIFNYVTNRWSFGEATMDLLYRVYSSATTLDDLNSIYGELDNVPGSLNDAIWSGGVLSFGGINGDHHSATFSGAPGTAVIETGEAQLGEGRSMVTAVRPLVSGAAAANISVAVKCRADQHETAAFPSQISLNAAGVAPMRKEGRTHAARIEITGDFDYAYGIEAYGGATGQR